MRSDTAADPIIEALGRVFRRHGYEAATLSILSAETGLKRSSLYHRFSGGKLDMAKAVLAHAGEILADYVFSPLTSNASLAVRTDDVITRIGEFYNQGRASCLLESLSVSGGADPELLQEVAAAAHKLVRYSQPLLKKLVKTQLRPSAWGSRPRFDPGSLVVARVSDDPSVFMKALEEVRQVLLS